MMSIRALRSELWYVVFCYFFWLSRTLAGELADSLTDQSDQYEGFYYKTYQFDNGDNASFSLAVQSKAFDSYLMLLSPNGQIIINDDHGDLGSVNPDNGADAGVRVETPTIGSWTLIVTTFSPAGKGEFDILSEGVEALRPVPSKEPASLFAARGVENLEEARQRRMAELAEQLSLATFRTRLEERLRIEHERAARDVETGRPELAAAENEKRRLEVASQGIAGLPVEIRTTLDTLIEEKSTEAEETIKYQSSHLVDSTSRREAYLAASELLKQLESLANELNYLRSALMSEKDLSQIGPLRERIRDIEIKFNGLAGEIARNLVESGLANSLTLEEVLDSRARFAGLVDQQPLASVMFYDDDLPTSASADFDPSVWLPRLLPWPPPDASARLVLPTDWLRRGDDSLPTTLGDLDDILQAALREAGYVGAGYLGVPTGFAVVTRLEQTTELGEPLDGDRRWATAILLLRKFSLGEYVRALLTAPPGYFRVLAFIVSAEPFASSGSTDRLEAIERWSTISVNRLPDQVRQIKYHEGYRVTVLVYEFVKKDESDEPKTTVPGHLTAQDHLARSGLLSLIGG